MNTTNARAFNRTLVIDEEGKLSFIYDDSLTSLLALGDAEITRASHVEPTGTDWAADLSPVGGPFIGPFQRRQEAIDAEIAWLLQHLIGGNDAP